jgi:hypothetical protein
MKLISITLLVITCFNLSFAQTNRNYKQEFNDLITSTTNKDESKLSFLRAVRLMDTKEREKYISDVKQSLTAESEQERLEAVKTLHFLLPYEKEQIIFRDFVVKEKCDVIKNQVYYYIGE